MLTSCGAILWTVQNGKPGFVLGLETSQWMPFKGVSEAGETWEQTAIREIYEETCGLVSISEIDLPVVFETKYKRYRLGLVYVDPSFLKRFRDARGVSQGAFAEKRAVRFFPIGSHEHLHRVAKIPIELFTPLVLNLAKKIVPFYEEKKFARYKKSSIWRNEFSPPVSFPPTCLTTRSAVH